MAEAVTLANFKVGTDSVYDIGRTASGLGVVEEVQQAFGYEGYDLGSLIGQVVPHKTLQDNIAFAVEALSNPSVQTALGYDGQSPAAIAHEWGVRSGLQTQVFRPLMEPKDATEGLEFAVAIEAEGVVNWMNRMADVTIAAAQATPIERMLLVSSGRLIGGAESPSVEVGTPVNKFMMSQLGPRLGATGLFKIVELVGTSKTDGNSVMARAAAHLATTEEIDLRSARVLAPAVAGNWAQKGVQIRQALQAVEPDFDTDVAARQLWVASDTFPLGVTGEEPKTTHQNPFSAIGNILRSAKLLNELH